MLKNSLLALSLISVPFLSFSDTISTGSKVPPKEKCPIFIKQYKTQKLYIDICKAGHVYINPSNGAIGIAMDGSAHELKNKSEYDRVIKYMGFDPRQE